MSDPQTTKELLTPPAMYKARFYEAIKKDPKKLDDEDIRALITRVGYLSDEERYKFRKVLTREKLQSVFPEEHTRYTRLFLLDRYFPYEADADAFYAHLKKKIER